MIPAVRVENLGKRYRLGTINRHMLYEELQSWWAGLRGKEDPNTPLVQKNPRHVGKGDFWALKDISFEINKGDVLGVIGRNGSGKSTLLKILSEITTPTKGRALIKGTVASLLEVGTGFHNELSGRENVYLNGSILGMSRTEINAKYAEIVEFAGIEEFMDTPVKRYSSGMKLRLAFAVAAHLEPEILILDEVLAVGDAGFQQKCMGRIQEVAEGGRTILFVSHNMAAVQSLCSRGIVLDEGRLVFSGTSEEAVNHYLRSTTAGTVTLRDRRDRSGSGEVRVVHMELLNLQGQPVGTVWSGQDVDLVLHLERSSSNTFPKMNVGIVCKNQLDAVIFKQHNRGFADRWRPLADRNKVVCRLFQLPLVEGNYRLDVRLRSDPFGQFLDQVENAFEFSVAGSNYFGSEDLSRSSKTACLVRGDWRIEQ